MSTTIGILELGRPPEELAKRYPSYAEMLASWVAPIGEKVTIYPIIDGAVFPEPKQADLWIISGSKCGVYEPHMWIPELEKFIRSAKDLGSVRMLGICFGHQIIAQALGGQVIKSDKGWGVGLHHYELSRVTLNNNKKITLLPEPFSIHAYHQDQVIEAPEGAEIIAHSDFCSIAALRYPGFALSFQGHPEFDRDYEADLIKLRLNAGILDKAIADRAIASLKEENTRLRLRDWFVKHWRSI